MVDIPERVYRGAHYSDVFVKVWAKIAALDVDTNGDEHCFAGVPELARFTGLSVRDVERALTEGRSSGPDGQEPEFTTTRRTHRGGKGRTAVRAVRPVLASERSVRVSVTMCEALEPRQLRAALLLAHAAADGHVPTAGELAGELFHHNEESKGKSLSARTARRITAALEESGWIGVDHRGGRQGRNVVTVHRHPLRPEPVVEPDAGTAHPAGEASSAAVAEPACADIHGGSGGDTGGGSLATREYKPVLTDGSTQVAGGIRRRRPDRSRPVAPAGDHLAVDRGRGKSGLRPDGGIDQLQSSGRPFLVGRGIRFSTRAWAVLRPVHHELPDIRPWLLMRIAKEIGRQLDAGATVERLADRLTRRYASGETIRDIGRWILGAGLPRRGCGHPDCESGILWDTGGADCETCAVNRQTAAARRAREEQLAAAEKRAAERRAQQQRRAAVDQEQQPQHRPEVPAPPALPVAPVMAPSEPWPAPASAAERAAATPDDVLAAIGRHGRAGAIHMYGRARVLPLLAQLPLADETGPDPRSSHAQ
jgi:hypothetical protein